MNIDKALAVSDYQCAERTAELTWLADQASRRRSIAEVGCWKGCTTRAIADNTSGTVYTVDTWCGNEKHPEAWQGKPGCSEEELFAAFRRNTEDLVSKLIVMRCDSVEAARALHCAGVALDMVFLDASHDYDSVKADVLAWRKLLKPGGLLCGHDRQWDGVAQAIDELVPGHMVGTGAIWYKVL